MSRRAEERKLEAPEVRFGSGTMTFKFAVVQGRLEPVEVTVSARKPLTTEMMRSVRWASLIAEAKRKYLQRLRAIGAGEMRELIEQQVLYDMPMGRRNELIARLEEEARKQLPSLEASLRRPGRPRQYGPEHFAQVARVYSEAYALGKPPTRAVADKFSVSHSAAAKWVAKARAAKLLPKTAPRVARGLTAERRREGAK